MPERRYIFADIHNANDSHSVKVVKSDLIAMLNHHWQAGEDTGYSIHTVNEMTYFGLDYES